MTVAGRVSALCCVLIGALYHNAPGIHAAPSPSTPQHAPASFHVPYDVHTLQSASARILLQEAYKQYGYEIRLARFSPDGTHLFFIDSSPYRVRIHFWALRNTQVVPLHDWYFDQNSRVTATSFKPGESCAFSPDNSLFAVGQQGRSSDPFSDSIELWSTKTGQRVGVLGNHHNSVISLVFSADGSELASGDASGNVNVYNVAMRQIERTWTPVLPRNDYGRTGARAYVAFQQEGTHRRVIAALGYTQPSTTPNLLSLDAPPLSSKGGAPTLEIWNIDAAERLQTITSVQYPDISSFSPDASELAVAVREGLDWHIKVIAWQQGRVFGDYRVHPPQSLPPDLSLFFSPDTSDVVALNFGRGDSTVYVANLAKLRQHLPT